MRQSSRSLAALLGLLFLAALALAVTGALLRLGVSETSPLAEARAARRGGDRWEVEAARQLLERALETDPHGEAHLELAELLFDRGENAQALERYEQCLAFDRGVAQVYVKMSAIHEREGRHPAALRVLEEGARYFAENAQPNDDYRSSARFLAWERARLATAGPRIPRREP